MIPLRIPTAPIFHTELLTTKHERADRSTSLSRSAQRPMHGSIAASKEPIRQPLGNPASRPRPNTAFPARVYEDMNASWRKKPETSILTRGLHTNHKDKMLPLRTVDDIRLGLKPGVVMGERSSVAIPLSGRNNLDLGYMKTERENHGNFDPSQRALKRYAFD